MAPYEISFFRSVPTTPEEQEQEEYPVNQVERAVRIYRRIDNAFNAEENFHGPFAALFYEETHQGHTEQCRMLTEEHFWKCRMRRFMQRFGRDNFPQDLLNVCPHLNTLIQPHVIPPELAEATVWIIRRGPEPEAIELDSPEFRRFQKMMISLLEHIRYSIALSDNFDAPMPKEYPELSQENLRLPGDL